MTSADDPCAHTGRPCINRHLCETCKIPQTFGFFLEYDTHGRTRWVQRFILKDDLKNILSNLDKEISKLIVLKDKFLRIPLKEQYNGTKENQQ